MAVESVRSELSDVLPDYELIRDCIAGQRAVKKRRDKYLPRPDPDDLSPAGKARYDTYLDRAVFYGATGRTHRGLIGLVFEKDPAIERPERLAIVEADASGNGVPLNQQAQSTLGSVVGLGRAGLFTDYPPTEGRVTAAQANAGNIRPTITRYEPEDIINWRTKTIGAKVQVSLVVLRESYVQEDDGFEAKTATQYRVLRLTGDKNIYTQEVWREGQLFGQVMTPTDGAGKVWNEIPFEFVGAEDNDPTVDAPPLLDLAELNKAHYRNSADYEESVFLVGQPTPVFAGLTKQWVDDVFTTEVDDGHGVKRKVSAVRLGSRAAVPLPAGGSAELLQAQPNSQAFEAMGHKEKQMIALGAKLIESSGTVQTATEVTTDSIMDNSVLGTCARNVSKAYRRCLQWAWRYMTGEIVDNPDVIDYELNTDFASRMLTAADRENIVGMWQKQAITWEEMRWNLKRTGMAYEDDEEAKEQISEDKQTAIDFEAAAAAAMSEAAGGSNQPPGRDE